MNSMIKNKARGGKKKREIKFIEDISSRLVTFWKRRAGVFSKVSELCVLTGAEGVVLCESLGGRVYAFAHPSVESVVGRYLGEDSSSELLEINSAASENRVKCSCMQDEFNKEYLKLSKEIEIEKNKLENVIGGINGNFDDNNVEEGGLFWWQQSFEHLEEEELEECISSMEELMNKLKLRANDLMLIRSSSLTFDASNTLNSSNHSGLSDEFLMTRNLNTTNYGLSDVNKNMTVMNYELSNEKMTGMNYGLSDVNKNMIVMNCELSNEKMTGMNYGLSDELFLNKNLTTNTYELPDDECFANKNMTPFGLSDNLLTNKNMTAMDYGSSDEIFANNNLTMRDYGLRNECDANKKLNFDNDGLLNELLTTKGPNTNDEVDNYFTDVELPLDYGNNLLVSNIGCSGSGNEVHFSETDNNLAVPDKYGKATDIHNFGTDVFSDDYSFSCPPNN